MELEDACFTLAAGDLFITAVKAWMVDTAKRSNCPWNAYQREKKKQEINKSSQDLLVRKPLFLKTWKNNYLTCNTFLFQWNGFLKHYNLQEKLPTRQKISHMSRRIWLHSLIILKSGGKENHKTPSLIHAFFLMDNLKRKGGRSIIGNSTVLIFLKNTHECPSFIFY